MGKVASFLAAFPPIQSAIKIDGMDGARIVIDIPGTELPNFLPALLLRGQVFRVTLTENTTELDNETEKGADKRTTKMGRRRADNP